MTHHETELIVVPDAAAAADSAAHRIAGALADAVGAHRRAHWATTGGSAAPPLYRRLAAPPLRDVVPWERVHVWWGDDRFVPADHPESNVLPFTQVLLGAFRANEALEHAPGAEPPMSIPVGHVHPVPVAEAIARGEGSAWAAARYTEALRGEELPRDAAGWPVLDLVLLGVGPDGHVLSVFPGSAAFDATEPAVAVPAPRHIGPHLERVSLNPALVGAAIRVIVVATGSSKAEALASAWAGGDPREIPARIAARPGATWILDEAAAAGIPR